MTAENRIPPYLWQRPAAANGSGKVYLQTDRSQHTVLDTSSWGVHAGQMACFLVSAFEHIIASKGSSNAVLMTLTPRAEDGGKRPIDPCPHPSGAQSFQPDRPYASNAVVCRAANGQVMFFLIVKVLGQEVYASLVAGQRNTGLGIAKDFATSLAHEFDRGNVAQGQYDGFGKAMEGWEKRQQASLDQLSLPVGDALEKALRAMHAMFDPDRSSPSAKSSATDGPGGGITKRW